MTAAHSPQRDRAFGRFFARRGLRLTRSCAEPKKADRMSSWGAKYFRLPAHERNFSTIYVWPWKEQQ
jgi:hypothetical protein